MYTLHEAIKPYRPAILLTRLISRPALSLLRRVTFCLWFFSLSSVVGLFFWWPESEIIKPLLGVAFLGLALWIEQILLYSYHNSFYFHGLSAILGESDKPVSGVTYEVSEAVLKNETDVCRAFCEARLGSEIILRLGIDSQAILDYLNSPRPKIATSMIPLPQQQIFSLIDLGKYLTTQDPTFSEFLKKQGLTHQHFYDTLNWIVLSHHTAKKTERWWGRDNLSKTQGIGRDWSYGVPYLLEKNSRDLRTSAVFSMLTSAPTNFTESKINEIAVALARGKAANVLLIGEPGVGKIDLLMEVERRLKVGKVIGAVENQKFILLDTNRIFATHRDKTGLELTLLNIFTEAANAGNIVVVIENLSNFVREAEALGVFIPELLDPFLASPALHVVATDTPGSFHTYLETLGGFTRRFAEVLVDTPDLSSTTRVLESITFATENKYRTVFTHRALEAVTKSADQYFVDGVMPDKAIELMLDIATRASQNGVVLITPDFVYSTVGEKTGIPVGPIGEQERDLLLNLETKLGERVIGQHEAISAIARTMRRARAGIQATNKPIGSFLFLGPSGVGKTETAKALAHTFFGNESALHRFDMSEFSGNDALAKMIGGQTETGLLSDRLREHPYCVLLLDEFEKGTRAVHDLFLQILDEGFFTDTRGEKINARNTIIIATSNAGAELIMNTISQRQAMNTLSEGIVEHIIKTGTYRPELINRFDSTIIFEPLSREEQGQVASLLLSQLYKRIKERGYELALTPDWIEYLVDKGYDPKFGARPMRRLIQDLIEEKIAQEIISGSVQRGGTIAFSPKNLNN
jgi:ATP-dependent Clp protease ATP-binding subunit ClpC